MSADADGEFSGQQLPLLGLALDRLPEAAYLIDRNGGFRYVNEAACRLLGHSAERLRRMTVWDVDPNFPQRRWPSHWEHLRRVRSLTFETCHRAEDGTVFPVEVTGDHFTYEGQEYHLALVRDLTERRRLELQQQVNMRFFECMDRINRTIHAADTLQQMMVDVLDVMLPIFDCDRVFLVHPCDPDALTWTAPMERTRPEYPGALELNVPIPTDADVAESFRILLDADGPVTFGPGNSFPMVEEVGRRFTIRSFMSMAIRPPVGKPWQLGIHQCSRERVWTPEEKRLLQEIGRRVADGLGTLLTLRDLRDSEQRYRRIVSTANEGIWVVDADERTTFVNARLCELLGYPAEEIIGRRTIDFTFPEDLPLVGQRLLDRRRGDTGQYERRFRHRDGHSVWTILSVTPSLDDGRQYQGAFAMVADITAKRLAEERVHRLNEELEQRVRQRTRQLEASNEERDKAFQDLQTAHARVLQQEKMASIGQLAAGIAHEINTPTQYVGDNLAFLGESFPRLLRAVRGHGEVGGDVPDASELAFLTEEIPHALHDGLTGIKRIASIVGAMKDFAHRSGDQPEPVDLTRLIPTTVEMSRHEWKPLGEVMLRLDPEASTVVGLRDELGQVLLNLLVNAAHAIDDAGLEPGAGRILVSTRRCGDWMEIQVQDNGCGIRPEVQRRIFEPFFTTKAVGRGSGQGLAIAYDIVVNKHGGQITAESPGGAGTWFTVRLPLDHRLGHRAENGSSPETAASVTSSP